MNRYSRKYTMLALLVLLALMLSACLGDSSTPEPAEIQEEVQAQVAALELAGTAWQLDYFGGESDNVPAIDGARATVNFLVERYGGGGGCNFFLGVYSTDGSAISMFTPNQTRLVCEEPEGVMEQDATFVSSLLNTVEYGMNGEQLVLYTTGQQPLATLSPAGDVAFEGTTWSLRLMKSGENVLPLLPGTTVTAQFEGEQVSGSSGCNTYNGGATIDGNSMTISENMITTMMACADPEGIMEQEQEYLTVLATVAGYDQVGGMLLLLDAAGEPVLLFAGE